MEKMVGKITEGTLIPISFVCVLAGGIVWLTALASDTKMTKQQVEEINQKQDSYMSEIRKVDERLSRIEGKLGINLNRSEK